MDQQQAKPIQPMGYSLPEIPRWVQYTSPVSQEWQPPRATTLPLNLIALIIAHLDDIGDIARVTRTSRLLYYMTLPQLYQRVSLHSYAELRRVNGRPEGFGSGSPFVMAVNGLVTKAHAALVQEFRVWGQWKEFGLDDFAEGRVPDNTMMLNILLRAATDKMAKLRSFAWELDCKPLKTVYQGLATHATLTSLTLKFPSSRMPRPSVTIPPIPNLRVFKATDIDPLCYCDDISMLMLHSKRLEDVRLHFSPRMRQEAEPSVNLNNYFGRCLAAEYKLPVKHFALQNFFGLSMDGMEHIFDQQTCRSITFLDTFGSAASTARTIFVDMTWTQIPASFRPNFHTIRVNEVRPQLIALLDSFKNLENFYFVGPKPDVLAAPNTLPSPGTPSQESSSFGRDFVSALTRNHGSTMKHLLLSPDWHLIEDDVRELVRFCPNLEQLGLSLDLSCSKAVLRLLMPFLSKLRVLRLLGSEWMERELQNTTHDERMARLGADLYKSGDLRVEWIIIGDMALKVGKAYQAIDINGNKEMRKKVTLAGIEEVQHIEIFRLDTLDLNADPVLPFSP